MTTKRKIILGSMTALGVVCVVFTIWYFVALFSIIGSASNGALVINDYSEKVTVRVVYEGEAAGDNNCGLKAENQTWRSDMHEPCNYDIAASGRIALVANEKLYPVALVVSTGSGQEGRCLDHELQLSSDDARNDLSDLLMLRGVDPIEYTLTALPEATLDDSGRPVCE